MLTIRRNTKAIISLLILLTVMYPVYQLMRNPDAISFAVSMVFDLGFIYFSFQSIKRREIVYQSTSVGVAIAGSKTGLYDPDFIAFADIVSVTCEANAVVIEIIGGEIVRLKPGKRHLDAIYHDLKRNMKQ